MTVFFLESNEIPPEILKLMEVKFNDIWVDLQLLSRLTRGKPSKYDDPETVELRRIIREFYKLFRSETINFHSPEIKSIMESLKRILDNRRLLNNEESS